MKNKSVLRSLVLSLVLALVCTGYSYAGTCSPPSNQPGSKCTEGSATVTCCGGLGLQFCSEQHGGEWRWSACES